MDVLTLLHDDHKAVSKLLDQAVDCEPGDERLEDLAGEIEKALTVHATIEEKYFYPELRDRSDEETDRVDVFEAFTEHDVLKHLISLLKSGRQGEEQFKAEVQVLCESVKHHIREEESTIFKIARELMDRDELDELGETMEAAKERLMARTPNGKASATRPRTTATRGSVSRTAESPPARQKAGTRRR